MSETANSAAILIVPRKVPYAFFKRFLDIVGGTILCLLFLPFMLLLAAAIKLTSRGPIFYRCERVGLGGHHFTFVKFRSMYVDAERRLSDLMEANEKDGPIFKMKQDPRITPIGRFIRKYSLDELPQMFAVVAGEMSLVGPRPPLPREVEQYDDYALQRLSIKPGITCYWQIMGRSDLTFEEWMDLDHRYLREMSFWTDLKILLKTPWAVIAGKGAY